MSFTQGNNGGKDLPASFEVRFEGDEVMRLEFRLMASSAFEYGNNTMVKVSGEGMPLLLDTRYDPSIKRDGSNFGEWCRAWIDERYRNVKCIVAL